MNSNDYMTSHKHTSTPQTFVIYAKVYTNGEVVAYVACTATYPLSSTYVVGFMDCSMKYHPLLKQFESWDETNEEYDYIDPSLPVIVIW